MAWSLDLVFFMVAVRPLLDKLHSASNAPFSAEAPRALLPTFPVWCTNITLQLRGRDSSLVMVSINLAISLLLFSSIPVEYLERVSIIINLGGLLFVCSLTALYSALAVSAS